jgi:hypothetical protein
MMVNLSTSGTASSANSGFATNVYPLAVTASGKCDVLENNGGNDILSYTPPSVAAIEGNLQELWTQIHAVGCKVIRLAVLPATSYADCGGNGCYAMEQELNAWAETQTKNAVLSVNPAATSYIDYFIPYDRVCNNDANANCYYTSGPYIRHTTPSFNEQAASLINDALIDKTHRAIANFDSTAPNAYLPHTNTRNIFVHQQEVDYNGWGDVGLISYQNNATYTSGGNGIEDVQPYMAVGQTHWLYVGSGQGANGWAGLGFYNAGLSSTSNEAILEIPGAASGFYVDGTGAGYLLNAAPSTGTAYMIIDSTGKISSSAPIVSSIIARVSFTSCTLGDDGGEGSGCIETKNWGTTISGIYYWWCTVGPFSSSTLSETGRFTVNPYGSTPSTSTSFTYVIDNMQSGSRGNTLPMTCWATN